MDNPLFYTDVVPLNSEAHRSMKLTTSDKPLAYAADAHLIPALVDEMELAGIGVPTAFVPGVDQPAAVFVCGVKAGSNVYINSDGLWDGDYVPAYLRRYPFIVGDVEGGEPLLCIDAKSDSLSESEGEALFDGDGNPQEVVERARFMATSYRDAANRTETFTGLLRDMNLLRAVSLDATDAEGAKTSLQGLLVINEEAIAQLSGDQLKQLADGGFLKAIYGHLASLADLSRLSGVAQETQADDAKEAVTGKAASPAAAKGKAKAKKA